MTTKIRDKHPIRVLMFVQSGVLFKPTPQIIDRQKKHAQKNPYRLIFEILAVDARNSARGSSRFEAAS